MLKQQRFKVKGPIIEIKTEGFKPFEPKYTLNSVPMAQRIAEYGIYKDGKKIGRTEVMITDKDVISREKSGHYGGRYEKGHAESNSIEMSANEYKGKGYGTMLLKKVEKDLKKEGMTVYDLQDVSATSFARKRGYRRINPKHQWWTKRL